MSKESEKFEKVVKMGVIAAALGILEHPNHRLVVIYTAGDTANGTLAAEIMVRAETPEIALELVEQGTKALKDAVINRN